MPKEVLVRLNGHIGFGDLLQTARAHDHQATFTETVLPEGLGDHYPASGRMSLSWDETADFSLYVEHHPEGHTVIITNDSRACWREVMTHFAEANGGELVLPDGNVEEFAPPSGSFRIN